METRTFVAAMLILMLAVMAIFVFMYFFISWPSRGAP